MEKLSIKAKTRITRDWQHCLPSMTVFRPMWLLKRNGPLLTGIALDGNRDNSAYRVIVHSHNLLVKTDFVSLTLWSPLQNARGTYHEEITLRGHEEKLPAACERLRSQSPLPLTDSLGLSEGISAYELYIKEKKFLVGMPIFMFQDIISLLVWCKRISEAEKALNKFVAEMMGWNEKVFFQVGGREAFFTKLRDLIERPEELLSIFSDQLRLLKVESIPDYGLSCD